MTCAWTNSWANNRDAGDLRRNRANYDVAVMLADKSMVSCQKGPTRHDYAWQIGPFWQDTLEIQLCGKFGRLYWTKMLTYNTNPSHHIGLQNFAALFSCNGLCSWIYRGFNTLKSRHDGRHFPDDIFKCILLNENIRISLKISLKFVPKFRINNIPALV